MGTTGPTELVSLVALSDGYPSRSEVRHDNGDARWNRRAKVRMAAARRATVLEGCLVRNNVVRLFGSPVVRVVADARRWYLLEALTRVSR